jgi:hypothetical protein
MGEKKVLSQGKCCSAISPPEMLRIGLLVRFKYRWQQPEFGGDSHHISPGVGN